MKTRPASPARPRTPGKAEPLPRPDRKQAILLAAEKLFAQSGYHGVSIRQIADEAGVPLALVGYYYGPKQDLFHAIFDHWRATIDERLALLAQAQAGPRDGAYLERVVHAFVEPVMRMRASAEGEYYALLVARELAYRTADADRVLTEYFDPMARAFIDALRDACPGSTRPMAAWAYQFALGSLIHHMSDARVQRLSDGANTPFDPAVMPLLVRFISAGVMALLTPPIPNTTAAGKTAAKRSRPATTSAFPTPTNQRRHPS